MTALPARLRTAALATAAALAVLLVCWAATAGPATLVHGGPPRQHGGPASPPPPQTATAGSDQAPQQLVSDLSWLGTLLVVGAALVLVVLLASGVRALRLRVGRRTARPEVTDDAVEGSPEEVRQALRRDAPGLLAVLDVGAPADGIVACWLRLERSVAEAGVRRAPWETSSEYAVRALRALDLDPRAVAGLAALYREARFSDHRLGEDARAAARSHLQRVAADLQELRA
jgi:hypothetical protein